MGCILYLYSAEKRDVLGNTSPEDQEISWGEDFAPRCSRDKPKKSLEYEANILGYEADSQVVTPCCLVENQKIWESWQLFISGASDW